MPNANDVQGSASNANIAGAVAGTTSGVVSGYLDNKANRAGLKEYIKQQKKLQGNIASMSANREAQTTGEYAPLTSGYAQNTQNYLDRLQNTDYSKYDVSAPGAYSGPSVNEITQQLVNPEIAQMETSASNAVQGSAANAGKLFSGITAKNIANAVADTRSKAYESARSAALQQDATNRQDYQNQFQNQISASNVNKSNLQQAIENLGLANTTQGNIFNQQQQQLQGIRSAADTATLGSMSEQAAAEAKKAGTKSGLMAGISGGLSGLANSLK